MSDERKARQGRLAFAFKEIFWVSVGLFGFVFTIYGGALRGTVPGPMLALLGGFALVSAAASIALDIARGSNAFMWTVVMLGVGAAIFLLFFYIYDHYFVNPPPIQFPFARPTPASR